MAKPKAYIHHKYCLSCGGCIAVCPQDTITMIGKKAHIEPAGCISCEICINTCPVGAITWEDAS